MNRIFSKGKFLSLLLLAAALTACNDDELSSSAGAPLQVSVTAGSPMVSRAIVTDEFLPDGSTIGVTVTDADGNSYDSQNYSNIKYTAAGTGDTQTWTGADAVSLSTTVGKAVAYYPWQEGADLTAIPVETASQTDYMYSKPVTGLSLASPAASFTMQHALTDIRIKVIRGDYTGEGALESVSVKSSAFATGATLNVHDGSLASISGTGTEFKSEYTDKTITAEGLVQDYLVVPVVSVTSGDVSVFIVVDGKKFTAPVQFTEAFLQGATYSFGLVLDNAGLNVTSVTAEKWGVKAEVDESLQLYDNRYIVEIQVPSDNYEYIHNIGEFVGTIDWGDGTTTEYANSTSYPTHTYTSSGAYIVIAEGHMTKLDSQMAGKNITKLVRIGKEMGVTSMYNAFSGQTLLTEIVSGSLDGCYNVTNFGYAFYQCVSLESIPEGLFDKCTEATTFYWAFYQCGEITTIPEGLFDKCTEVKDFYQTFADCSSLNSIPEGLFDKCTEVTSFSGTFRNTGIFEIPEGLFDKCTEVTSFGGPNGGIFEKCKSLKIIPPGLFDNCPEVKDFTGAFNGCESLTSIPEGLFENNTKVTNVWYLFMGCKTLQSIPEGLLDSFKNVTSFYVIFAGCDALQTIPEGLFDYNTKVTSFQGAFSGCISLTEIPEGLFDNCPEVTDFHGVFSGCSSLQTIPVGLFDNCTKVTSFENTFLKSSNLNCESPYTIINVDGQDIKVHLYERANYPEQFTAPTKYSKCYNGCTKMTDYSSMPSEWK